MSVRTATGAKADWSQDMLAEPIVWTNIPEVRVWRITPGTEAKEYASSSTGGAKRRIGETNDFSGTVDLYVDATNRFDTAATLGIVRGAQGGLKLYEDDTNFHIAEVYIDSVDYEADIEGGEILPATINFSSNGNWTPPGGGV